MKKITLAFIAMVLMSGCGEEKNAQQKSADSKDDYKVTSTGVYRQRITSNGFVLLSSVFLTFKPSDPGMKINDVKVRIEKTTELKPMGTPKASGTVDEKSLSTVRFDTDQNRESQIRESILKSHRGDIYIYWEDASSDVVKGKNEFIVTFSTPQGTKTLSVLAEGMSQSPLAE